MEMQSLDVSNDTLCAEMMLSMFRSHKFSVANLVYDESLSHAPAPSMVSVGLRFPEREWRAVITSARNLALAIAQRQDMVCVILVPSYFAYSAVGEPA